MVSGLRNRTAGSHATKLVLDKRRREKKGNEDVRCVTYLFLANDFQVDQHVSLVLILFSIWEARENGNVVLASLCGLFLFSSVSEAHR